MSNILQTLLDTYRQNPAAALALIPELGQAVEDCKIVELPCKVGSTVYVTVSGDHYYRATLFGYGAYGNNPNNTNHKTYCVRVHRGDGYSFVDFFQKIYTQEEAAQALKERGKNG